MDGNVAAGLCGCMRAWMAEGVCMGGWVRAWMGEGVCFTQKGCAYCLGVGVRVCSVRHPPPLLSFLRTHTHTHTNMHTHIGTHIYT